MASTAPTTTIPSGTTPATTTAALPSLKRKCFCAKDGLWYAIEPAKAAYSDGIAKVHVESWKTSYTFLPPHKHRTLESRTTQWRKIIADNDKASTTFALLVHGDGHPADHNGTSGRCEASSDDWTVVGFAIGGMNRYESPIKAPAPATSAATKAAAAEEDAPSNEQDDGDSDSDGGGACSMSLDAVDGELWCIYLLDSVHRRGLGAKLALTLLKHLVDRGLKRAVVWYYERNAGARAFYDSLGAKPIRGARKVLEEAGGADFPLVAHGWEDVASAVASSLHMK